MKILILMDILHLHGLPFFEIIRTWILKQTSIKQQEWIFKLAKSHLYTFAIQRIMLKISNKTPISSNLLAWQKKNLEIAKSIMLLSLNTCGCIRTNSWTMMFEVVGSSLEFTRSMHSLVSLVTSNLYLYFSFEYTKNLLVHTIISNDNLDLSMRKYFR